MARRLLRELIPHAPQHGLYRAPDVPEGKLRTALRGYATGIRPEAVLALYDATRLGSASDGGVFLEDRLVYRNHRLAPTQTIRYDDVVGVKEHRTLLGGRRLRLDVNEARATVTHDMDFSAQPEAAAYVARFLQETLAAEPDDDPARTDEAAVRAALDDLSARGLLAEDDRRLLLEALRGR